MTTSNQNTVTSKKDGQADIKKTSILSDSSEREQWLEESAYFMAEARGFIPGFEQNDWDMAEKKYENTTSL
jgi:hypothetical protein